MIIRALRRSELTQLIISTSRDVARMFIFVSDYLQNRHVFNLK